MEKSPYPLIYQIRRLFAPQYPRYLLADHDLHAQETGAGIGGDVGRADGVGEHEERMVGHGWFGIEHVEGGACQVA